MNKILITLCFATLNFFAQAQSLIAKFSYSSNCLHNPSYFSDSSVSKNGTINYWSWNFGDGNTKCCGIQNPSHIYHSLGTFPVTLVVKNLSGDTDTIINDLVVHDFPKTNFILTSVGDSIKFTDQTTSIDPLKSWYWRFNHGTPDSSISKIPPLILFSGSPASNKCSLITTSIYGCSDTLNYLVSWSVKENNQVNLISIFPNPVTGSLSLNTDGSKINVKVVDLNGRVLRENAIQTKNFELDVSDLSEGIYFLQLQMDKIIQTTKFIKE